MPTTSSSITKLDHVIQKEPLDFFDPELRGLAAIIGIRKGKKFAPDERMKKILTEAVAVGNATARAMCFRNRDPRVPSIPTASGNTCSSPPTTAGSTGRGGRPQSRRAHEFLLRAHRQHAGR